MTEEAVLDLGVTRIGVFARVPRPGTGKTRLAAGIGPERATTLAAAFLGDSLERARLVAPADTWWWIAPEPGREEAELVAEAAAAGLAPAGTTLALQRGAHLGERMAHALAAMLPAGPAILVGADVPDLPLAALERARTILLAGRTDGRPRLVLGPADDGGFYLVGCDAPPGDWLAGPAHWGGDEVLARTRDGAERGGWGVTLLDPWGDVDTPADLGALEARLEAGRRAGAAARPGWPGRTAALLLGDRSGGGA